MEDLTTMGLVVGASMAIIKVLEISITKFFEYLNGTSAKGNKDADQQTEIALLKKEQEIQCGDILELRSNHLKHQEKIEKQMEKNAEEHHQIFIILERIETKLK